MIVGLIVTVVIWSRFGVWGGLLSAFLLMGGIGWKLVLAIPGGLVRLFSRGQSQDFIRAWEARAGEMEFGAPSTYPPPGLYQAWRADNKQSGIGAGEWLDRQVRQAQPRAGHRVEGIRGKGAYRGFRLGTQYEGVVYGTDEGLVVVGSSPEGEEVSIPVKWDSLKQVRIVERDGKTTLLFDPKEQGAEYDPTLAFAFIEVIDFDEGVDVWHSFVQGRLAIVDKRQRDLTHEQGMPASSSPRAKAPHLRTFTYDESDEASDRAYSNEARLMSDEEHLAQALAEAQEAEALAEKNAAIGRVIEDPMGDPRNAAAFYRAKAAYYQAKIAKRER